MSPVGEAKRFVSPGLPGETKRSVSDDAEGVLGERDFSVSPSGGSRLPEPPPLGDSVASRLPHSVGDARN